MESIKLYIRPELSALKALREGYHIFVGIARVRGELNEEILQYIRREVLRRLGCTDFEVNFTVVEDIGTNVYVLGIWIRRRW